MRVTISMKIINSNGWAPRNTMWTPYWGELVPISDPLITSGHSLYYKFHTYNNQKLAWFYRKLSLDEDDYLYEED
jgi:hypothetical protein